MVQERKKISNVLLIIMGAVAGALAVLLVLLFLMTRVPGLNGQAQASSVAQGNSSVPEARTVENNYSGFTVSRPGVDSFDGAMSGQPVMPVIPQTETPEEAVAAGFDYICPVSSDRALTENDIEEAYKLNDYPMPLGKSVAQMMINEIYARHGYAFTTPEIQAFFDQKPWYQAIPFRESNMDVISANLSQVERNNVDYLKTYLR